MTTPSGAGRDWPARLAAAARTVCHGINWRAVVSLRVLFTAILLGAIAAALAGALWKPLTAPVGAVVLVGIWVLAILNTDNVLVCPHCLKRVKIGAERCHHCGQPVR